MTDTNNAAPTAGPAQTTSNMPGSAAVNIVSGDRVDIDALRELSVAEYDAEFGETVNAPSAEEKQTAKRAKAAAPVDDYVAEDETYEEGQEADDGVREDDAVGEDVEASRDDVSEDVDGAPEEVSDDDEPDSNYLKVKAKNGKIQKISKDATFEVKIDGKVEELTAQEVVNRASGAVAYDRKHTELGRERKAFQRQVEEFEKTANVTNQNYAMFSKIAESGTPEDFAQYYGMLTGKDPDVVLKGIVENAIKHAEMLENMTARERDLYNQNRKYKFSQELKQIEAQNVAQQQTAKAERAMVEQILSDDGLDMNDFLAAAQDVKARIEAGELKGRYSARDVAEYAVTMKQEARITESIAAVDKQLLSDDEFVGKVIKTVVGIERTHGERFTPEEIRKLVKTSLASKKQKSEQVLRESLSKKVERAKKSGKTNSQTASSRNQETNGAGNNYTMSEWRDKIRGVS